MASSPQKACDPSAVASRGDCLKAEKLTKDPGAVDAIKVDPIGRNLYLFARLGL